MDPEYTGATGHYVDLGIGYDRKALFAMRGEIIAACRAYRSCYPEAYRCIGGAMESRRRGSTLLHTEETLVKTEKRAAGILAKELKTQRPLPGRRRRRFLGGPTCQGRILLEDTIGSCVNGAMRSGMTAGFPAFSWRIWRKGFWQADMTSSPAPARSGPAAWSICWSRKNPWPFVTGPWNKKKGFPYHPH